MQVLIKSEPLDLTVFGFAGTAVNKDYTGTAFKLMGKMWQTVKINNLNTEGHNIWVYEENDSIFAGVRLNDIANGASHLEHKQVILLNYAYYKHIGPYHLIKDAGQNMKNTLHSQGYTTTMPYIEIYGHWTNDETTLETELLMALK